MEEQFGKDIPGHYVENIEEFKNATGTEDNKKIKSEEFNNWMAYLLIANSDQPKHASLENLLASQRSMKKTNTQRT